MWRIRVKSKDKRDLARFIFDERLDVSCGGILTHDYNEYEIEAYVNEAKKKNLAVRRNKSVEIQIVEDMSASGIDRLSEVSKENRFRGTRSATPKGFGIKE